MIATGDYNIQIAKQSARGVYPAAPTYFLEMVDGGISSKPDIKSLNISDGRIFGASKKTIGYVDTGGECTITGQPKDIGAMVAYAGWTDTPAGGGDPYTHTFVPPTSFSAFPYFSAWVNIDDQWYFFGDLQIVKLGIETTNKDDGYFRLKPTIIGFAKEEFAAAPAAATQETSTLHWLHGGGYHNLNGDYTNMAHIAVPTDLATLKTSLASFKTVYNAHLAVASGKHHKAADAANTLAFATPLADLAACIVALTEIRADLIAHEALTTTHYFADTTANNPSSAWIEPCVTLADCLLAAQDLLGDVNSPGCYNRHVGAQPAISSFKLDYDMNATPYQGEGVTAYCANRKPGMIGVAAEILQENFRLINLAKFGTPAPTAGTEITTTIQQLSWSSKFIQQASPERSIAFSVPTFDLDSEPFMGFKGNPEGDDPVLVVGGEATGSAPIATVTILNNVATY